MKKFMFVLLCLSLVACASTPSTQLKRSPCAGAEQEAMNNAGE